MPQRGDRLEGLPAIPPMAPPPADPGAGIVFPDPDDLDFGQLHELQEVVAELGRRKLEALRLYEPLAEQQRFHASDAMERLLRGSNRGGKTLPAAAEVARAITGTDPFGKYPKENGRCFAVGKNGRHIGQVMWRKLSHPSAFKIIRDTDTGLWRAYRPWVDAHREGEARHAPPLIPVRMIASIAWENKKANWPAVVKLTNGWEITFWTSEGKPPQGADVDLVWFDEEITDPEWYPEMAGRVLDRRGRFLWSATPQAATQQLYDLHCRAVDGDELVEEFVILLRDNPHISQAAKDKFAAKLGAAERRVRIDGDFAIASYKVYPEFDKGLHVVPRFEVPEHWMRLASIDPGRQILAALFLAVPPPDSDLGRKNQVLLFDELYLRNADAAMFGQAMAQKVRHHSFWKFIIDGNAARQGEIGSGKSIQQQYAGALRDNKVRSESTGHDFQWGADDVAAGIEALRNWLRIRPNGTPRLVVMAGACPNFVDYEIGRYHYKRVAGIVTDKPEQKNNHLMDCGRYLAMEDPSYQPPARKKRPPSGAIKAFRDKQARMARAASRDGGSTVTLGPGGGLYGTGGS